MTFPLWRRRPREQAIVAALALLLIAGGRGDTGAQSATPEAYPIAPDPAACVVAPMAMDDLVMTVGTPSPGEETLAPEPATLEPFVIPPGEAADAETAAAVIATLHEVFACTNAGDFPRVYALFTADFTRDFFAQTPLTPDVIAFLGAPPQPLPTDQQRIIVRFGEVQMLDDGRAGVVVVLDEPDDPRTEEPDFAILKWVAGRWLVDEIHEDGGMAASSPETATPTP
jgi:hypothetical protein